MTNQYDIDLSCGKGRRGCCIVQPDDDSDNILLFDIVFGLHDGTPSVRSVVSIKNTDLADYLGEAPR